MKLKRLQLTNFRNYDELDLSFNDGLTILTGENAQGKTNLLEAIFLLSMAKSHRTNIDKELIKWDDESAKIIGEVETKNYEFPLELQFQKKGKIAKVNHLDQPKLSLFIGKLNVVLFAPEDLQIVKGSPSLRRKFIDAELAQSHPVYLQELLDYNRILKQRNKFLKDFGHHTNFDELYFEVLTDQLIEKAVSVIKYRRNFIEKLNDYAGEIHYELSNQRDKLTLSYDASSSKLNYNEIDTLTEQFKELFKSAIDREKYQSTTVYGPHRDDLSFYLNDKLASHFGSQGQQRLAIISLKLAEIDIFNKYSGSMPILLLDDVFSELDDEKKNNLLKYLKKDIQTIITTTDLKNIDETILKDAKLIEIDSGTVVKINEEVK